MTTKQKIIDTMQAEGVTAYRLCKDLNIPQSSFSRWKRGLCDLSGSNLDSILNHLNLIK